MQKFKWCAVVIAAGAAMFLSGCLLFPASQKEVKVYDLGYPKTVISTPFYVCIQPWQNDSSTRYKMVMRGAENQLNLQEHDRWSQTPGMMLTKFLALSFANGSKDPKVYNVTGKVLVFEADTVKKQANLFVECRIQERDGKIYQYPIMISQPMKEDTPQAFAEAMTNAAGKLAEVIAAKIKLLPAAK